MNKKDLLNFMKSALDEAMATSSSIKVLESPVSAPIRPIMFADFKGEPIPTPLSNINMYYDNKENNVSNLSEDILSFRRYTLQDIFISNLRDKLAISLLSVTDSHNDIVNCYQIASDTLEKIAHSDPGIFQIQNYFDGGTFSNQTAITDLAFKIACVMKDNYPYTFIEYKYREDAYRSLEVLYNVFNSFIDKLIINLNIAICEVNEIYYKAGL